MNSTMSASAQMPYLPGTGTSNEVSQIVAPTAFPNAYTPTKRRTFVAPGPDVEPHEQQVHRHVGEHEARGLSFVEAVDGRGQPEYAEHRRQQRDPVSNVVVVEGGRVPGKAHPRPPHRHEKCCESQRSAQRWVVVQTLRERRDSHDEAEVEEQLEPGRGAVLFGRITQYLWA